MRSFTERLYQALEKQLHKVSEQHQGSECDRLKTGIKLCKKAMSILKKYTTCYFFESLDDEIIFFKQIKPLFYSKYIYYISVYNFQIKKPTGSEETLKEYISSEIADLKRFFDHNQTLYQYYRTSGSHLDNVYFTRGCFDVYTELEDFQGDELFSTSHDYKFSKIIANEEFQKYLNLQTKSIGDEFRPTNESPIVWTSNQTDLVELIYALVETGAFNNGNVEIKNLMDCFQNIFQVDLKYYYRKYTDITNRKKERTAFLDRLKLGLIKKMDSKYELQESTLRRMNF